MVLMYFINNIPFTFDDAFEDYYYYFDRELFELASKERRWEPEDLYRASSYLIQEECHPLIFELELENPECMPVD